MSTDTDFSDRFVFCIPALMKNRAFAAAVRANLASSVDLLNRLPNQIDEEEKDELFDAAFNAYEDCADRILTLGWDGDAPGLSGAIWLLRCQNIYVISSTDVDPFGPYSSLEEALKEECFNAPTANPDLSSDVLPQEVLLKIATQVVDRHDMPMVLINSRKYRVYPDAKVVCVDE